jgi:hypothetical protein
LKHDIKVLNAKLRIANRRIKELVAAIRLLREKPKKKQKLQFPGT